MSLTLAVVAALCSLSARLTQDTPTSTSLIALMPPGTESVMVWRIAELRSGWMSESVPKWSPWLFAAPSPRPHGLGPVKAALTQAVPDLWVVGGSRFEGPEGLGVGTFVERSVWHTTAPIALLRDELAKAVPAEGVEFAGAIEGVAVFLCRPIDEEAEEENAQRRGMPASEPRYVAVPDDHLVFLASTREDIQHMVQAHLAGKEAIPEQWAEAAAGRAIDVEALLLVLRRYDPESERDRYSPANRRQPLQAWAPVRWLALSMPQAGQKVFHIHVRSSDPKRAADAIADTSLSMSIFEWKVSRNKSGFWGTLRERDDQEDSCVIGILVAFGLNVAI